MTHLHTAGRTLNTIPLARKAAAGNLRAFPIGYERRGTATAKANQKKAKMSTNKPYQLTKNPMIVGMRYPYDIAFPQSLTKTPTRDEIKVEISPC